MNLTFICMQIDDTIMNIRDLFAEIGSHTTNNAPNVIRKTGKEKKYDDRGGKEKASMLFHRA